MTTLPTPEQWVIRKMTEIETAEMIERRIDTLLIRTVALYTSQCNLCGIL